MSVPSPECATPSIPVVFFTVLTTDEMDERSIICVCWWVISGNSKMLWRYNKTHEPEEAVIRWIYLGARFS